MQVGSAGAFILLSAFCVIWRWSELYWGNPARWAALCGSTQSGADWLCSVGVFKSSLCVSLRHRRNLSPACLERTWAFRNGATSRPSANRLVDFQKSLISCCWCFQSADLTHNVNLHLNGKHSVITGRFFTFNWSGYLVYEVWFSIHSRYQQCSWNNTASHQDDKTADSHLNIDGLCQL